MEHVQFQERQVRKIVCSGCGRGRGSSLARWLARSAGSRVRDGGLQAARSKAKLTGEWLIFGVHEQKNIYLSICIHSNSPEQDREIYDALLALCGDEFPDVFTRHTE